MAITEERLKVVNFTAKYDNTPSRLVAKAGAALEASNAGLKGKRIGVQRSTIQDRFATATFPGSEIVRDAKADEVCLDLAAGRVDVVFGDTLAVDGGFLKKPPGRGFAFFGPSDDGPKFFGTGSGIAVRKADTALQQKFNAAITTIIRAVPDLALMLLVFYGGQMAINSLGDRLGWADIDIDPWAAGILTIGVIFGACFTEVLRGAFQAVPAGEVEAARALGMGRWLIFRRIVLPSAMRRSLPAYSNEVVLMLHGTALTSVVTLRDLTGVAREVNAIHDLPFEAFITAALCYLAITMVLVGGFQLAERRWLRPFAPRG